MSDRAGKESFCFDVGRDRFEEDVIHRSQQVPVVVDFWARWCGPCRALGPLLEDLADEYAGKFLLAKVDIDKEADLAQEFQVSSIPLVLAFVEGKPVTHFMGALPEPAVRKFIERLVPSPSMEKTRQALTREGLAVEEQRRLLEEAVTLDSDNTLAAAFLAEILLDAGDETRAKDLLKPIHEASDGWAKAHTVTARLGFAESARHLPGLEVCQHLVTTEPANVQRWIDLALVQAARGCWKESLESFVSAAEKDSKRGEQEVRPLMVEIFNILGQQHPLTAEYRHRLAVAIYS
jgi:putative thioredoxin